MRETKLEPGSLKAMWPSGPIPVGRNKIFHQHKRLSTQGNTVIEN